MKQHQQAQQAVAMFCLGYGIFAGVVIGVALGQEKARKQDLENSRTSDLYDARRRVERLEEVNKGALEELERKRREQYKALFEGRNVAQ